MRLTRHAKNNCRLYEVEPAEAEKLVVPANLDGADKRGNLLFTGEVDGRTIPVVVALDDPNVIITIIDRSR